MTSFLVFRNSFQFVLYIPSYSTAHYSYVLPTTSRTFYITDPFGANRNTFATFMSDEPTFDAPVNSPKFYHGVTIILKYTSCSKFVAIPNKLPALHKPQCTAQSYYTVLLYSLQFRSAVILSYYLLLMQYICSLTTYHTAKIVVLQCRYTVIRSAIYAVYF